MLLGAFTLPPVSVMAAAAGLPAQAAPPGWKRHIARQLKQRDRAQKTQYQDVIQCYNKLLEKSSLLRHVTERLQTDSPDSRSFGSSEYASALDSCLGIQTMQRLHTGKVLELINSSSALAYEVIEKEKILKERQGIVEEKKYRMFKLEGQLVKWKDKQLRCRALAGAQENVNLELKRGYDDLLETMKHTEKQLRKAEEEKQGYIQDILAFSSRSAERLNNFNDRMRRQNMEWEIKRALRTQVKIHADTGETKPGAKEPCKKDLSGQPDKERPLQRPFRSPSATELRRSSLRGLFKGITKKIRSNSVSTFSEERYQCLPVCVLARVPSKAVCVMETHDSEVTAVKFSPNSKLLATGGASRHIDLWDIVGGSLTSVQKLEGSNSSITSVEFDPTGNHILAATYEKAAHLWNINNCLPRETLTGHTGKVTAAKFMSTLQRAVTGSWDRTVKEWDLSRGACLRTIPVSSYCSDVVCADYFIASGHHDKKIRFWDSRLERCTQDISVDGKVTSLNLSYNQTQLLCCSRDDELKVIDLRMRNMSENSKVFRADGFKCGCDWTKAIFSPDGSYAIAGSADGTIFIWDVNSGKLERSLCEEHRSSVNAVAWSLSGEYVASVDRGKKAVLWSEF